MNKMVSFVLVAILAGCSAEGPTAPTPVTETASTPPVVAANPAPVALVPVPPGVRLNFYNNAAFEVFNDTADVLVVTSYITSFDDQVTPLEPKRSEPVQPGQSLNTSYNRGCVQLDVDQIGFAFYDQDGKQVDRITQAIRDACAPKPSPEPSPSPSPSPEPSPEPTPPPCVNVPTTRDVNQYAAWDSKGYYGEECGIRYYAVIRYTKDSCTGVETHEQIGENVKETKTCSVEPLVGICHTENPALCKWTWINPPGWGNSYWGYACKQNPQGWDALFYTTKLYQCQDKTEKKTGHIPNHNGGGDHVDYLGTCQLATPDTLSNRCWKILN